MVQGYNFGRVKCLYENLPIRVRSKIKGHPVWHELSEFKYLTLAKASLLYLGMEKIALARLGLNRLS